MQEFEIIFTRGDLDMVIYLFGFAYKHPSTSDLAESERPRGIPLRSWHLAR